MVNSWHASLALAPCILFLACSSPGGGSDTSAAASDLPQSEATDARGQVDLPESVEVRGHQDTASDGGLDAENVPDAYDLLDVAEMPDVAPELSDTSLDLWGEADDSAALEDGADVQDGADFSGDSGGLDSSCVPDCTDKQCGDDGCGGSCGDCVYDGPMDLSCIEIECVAFTCEFTPQSTVCDDGDGCTIGDTCVEGYCVSGTLDEENPHCVCCTETGCPDNDNLCDVPSVCNPNKCVCEPAPEEAVECTAGDDPCMVNKCVPATGECETVAAAPGTPCDDGDACTKLDACSGGNCLGGGAVDCDDSNACTEDSCDPLLGCQSTPVSKGAPCPGGSLAQCLDGECVCFPICQGKECGDNGCGGSCGSCGPNDDCINGFCVKPAGCGEILVCFLDCGFQACYASCLSSGTPEAQFLFSAVADCAVDICGVNGSLACISGAVAGPCANLAQTCMAN